MARPASPLETFEKPLQCIESQKNNTSTPQIQIRQSTNRLIDNDNSPVQPSLSINSPIVYYYLTHETWLPLPTQSSPLSYHSQLWSPPDLLPYVSPFNWPQSRKTFTTCISCAVTVVTAYTAGSYSPPSQQMAQYWGVSHVAILVGITTFTTGMWTQNFYCYSWNCSEAFHKSERCFPSAEYISLFA